MEANLLHNVIAAWPRGGNNYRDAAWMNHFLLEINNITKTADLDSFGLSYPIEIEDLVYNWEAMLRFWFAKVGYYGRYGIYAIQDRAESSSIHYSCSC